ncbi:patatin-like phospholipase domain-containing protein [Cryptococcus amylolentus CBS 6039]|uniref:Patatin-like phospholipase domain-containing protein n=3 Tax=Cryptococcus amylolentus TaxID=104669 RepID=A0A1E3HR35_9TREE|nr:patatin-like phospholipase domain-containing protein [Cryptococcus amylolentus CBS 6039]ODN78595.1 patatin-like phospholipase domain-containing protein [Cryptococcus amylolentus CBS 6039]ODO06855.1 patatin-like phospholipase domain-containing protein [Cryptococcus amylolentus CBS 6273]
MSVPDWDTAYVNEEHVDAFAQALSYNDLIPAEGEFTPGSPRSPGAPIDSPSLGSATQKNNQAGGAQTWQYGPDNGAFGSGLDKDARVEKLTATSDFAPIHQRVSRRRQARATSQGLTYHLIRWPLLFFFFFIIYLEFSAYVVTRQVVNVFEWLVAWRGHKAKLRRELRKAKTYEEWTAAALKLDEHMGFEDWKETEEDSYFDWTLVRRVKRTLTRLRSANDTRGLMDALAVCVRANFAGTESVKMYSETFIGTKKVVEAHVKEVAASLDYVRTASNVSLEEKRAFFRAINKHYGSSALCLSGGASFGYYHFGVIRAFLEADLLPRVITGTSAGGLAAALVCTRTNDELQELLVPELADKITACEDSFRVWIPRWRATGARFDTIKWARKAMWFTRGSLTFKEAYARTGRALNISVVPSDRHSPTILLNHLTAPNCLIWSAIIASAAVPGILNPVVLMAKDRNGNVKPHNLGGSRFKDGSLREDIPLGSLHTQFNCNFSIVSQTNPHIHLFFFAPRGSVGRPVAHRKGKGWRGGFLLSALESYIKLDLSKHFKVIRDLDLMPQILQSDWSGVFLQRFSGDLTLTPRSTIQDWFHILSDPTRQQLERMLTVGEKVTWPALRMVRNRMTIERAILRGRTEVRFALNRNRTSNDHPHSLPAAVATDADPNSVFDHIPIESDVDAGFTSRSKRVKARNGRGVADPEVLSLAGVFQSESETRGARKRRGQTPSKKDNGKVETLRDIPESSSVPFPASGSPQKGYFGETLRHVRAPSLSSLSSPFRSIRSSLPSKSASADSASSSSVPQSPTTISQRPRSQLSITRWFGGASESSSEEDEEEEELLRIRSRRGTATSSEDGISGFQLDTAVDSHSESDSEGVGGVHTPAQVFSEPHSITDTLESEGVTPIPGGERVSQETIDAGAAAGQRLRRNTGEREGKKSHTGEGKASTETPPGQDG